MPPKRRHAAPSIERWLRERIDKTLPGDPLPSTSEIAEEFDVSRATALTVYRKLAGEGLVDIRTSAGVFKV